MNFKDLINAQRNGILEGLNFGQVEGKLECDICVQGKMTRTTFPKNSERKTDLLEIVHSDVCGPMRVESLNKAKYFVTFIDDSSKWCEVYFLRSKSEVLEKFKEFQKKVENQKERKVKYVYNIFKVQANYSNSFAKPTVCIEKQFRRS